MFLQSEQIRHPPTRPLPGMKTQKPPAKKAVKAASRTVRRVPRAAAKTPRVKGKSPKRKAPGSKTVRKPAARLRAKPGAAAKTRGAKKPVIRRRKPAAAAPRAAEPLPLPVDQGPEIEAAKILFEDTNSGGRAPSRKPSLQTGSKVIAKPPAGRAKGVLPSAVGLVKAGQSGLEVASTVAKKPTAPEKPRAAQSRTKAAPARPALQIPPILLEGDKPRPAGARSDESAELPESYGTGKLLLVARDPHWLYTHWDLAPEKQQHYNAQSADHHLVVRLQPGTLAGHTSSEIHVHPESRSWFIQVDRAATQYSAELGYYPANRQWVTVATSAPVVTPPDAVSADKTLRFATIPIEVPPREFTAPGEPARSHAPGDASLPAPRESAFPQQTRRAQAPPFALQQERALAAVFHRYRILQEPASSAEIPELIRSPLEGEAPSPPIEFPASPGGPIQGISSPLGSEEFPLEGFRLNLNAELVLYGATEPDASLTIGGQPIALRPDGTFSFRFSLPDGDYELSVSARSARGDSREAALKFTRRTDRRGEIGTIPPDLPPPTPT